MVQEACRDLRVVITKKRWLSGARVCKIFLNKWTYFVGQIGNERHGAASPAFYIDTLATPRMRAPRRTRTGLVVSSSMVVPHSSSGTFFSFPVFETPLLLNAGNGDGLFECCPLEPSASCQPWLFSDECYGGRGGAHFFPARSCTSGTLQFLRLTKLDLRRKCVHSVVISGDYPTG